MSEYRRRISSRAFTCFVGVSLVFFCRLTAAAEQREPADEPAHVATDDPKNWYIQHHESFLKRGKEGKIGVLFIGDSITEGWKGAADIWDKYYGLYDPANFGIGGDRTQALLWRLDNGELDGIDPDVVVLMIGTNNSDYAANEIASAIRKVADLIHRKLPRTKLLLLGILPRGTEAKDPAIAALRTKIE